MPEDTQNKLNFMSGLYKQAKSTLDNSPYSPLYKGHDNYQAFIASPDPSKYDTETLQNLQGFMKDNMGAYSAGGHGKRVDEELAKRQTSAANPSLNPSQNVAQMSKLEEATLAPRLQELEARVKQNSSEDPSANLQNLVGQYTNFSQNTKLSPAQKAHVDSKMQELVDLHNRTYGPGINQTETEAAKEQL